MGFPVSEQRGPAPETVWLEALTLVEGEGHRAALDDAAGVAEAEAGQTMLVDRLRHAQTIDIDLEGARARGRVGRVGRDAVEVAGVDGVWLVPLDRILGVTGLVAALPPEEPRARRPSLAALARAWVGLPVDVLRSEWGPVRGVLRAAFADHLEVQRGEERMAVPVSAVIALRRPGP